MTQPISPVPDLDAIRAELGEIEARKGDRAYRGDVAWYTSMWATVGRHVPALVAEVERLREERDSALEHAEMSGEQTVAYEAEVERLRSGQPWEELFHQRDDAIAERDRLRVAGALHYAEVQRLREDVIGPLRAERDRLHQIIGALDAWIYSKQPSLIGADPVSAVIGVVEKAWAENGRVRGQRNDLANERDRWAEVIQAARLVHAASAGFFHDGPAHVPADELVLLIAAVDRLGDDDG